MANIPTMLANTKKSRNNKSLVQETLTRPSIDQKELVLITTYIELWMWEIIQYFKECQLLKDKNKSTKFVIIVLKQVEYVTGEVGEGVCITHIGERYLVS